VSAFGEKDRNLRWPRTAVALEKRRDGLAVDRCSALKSAFHDTDIDTDILARIFRKGVGVSGESARVSVSVSWNAAFTGMDVASIMRSDWIMIRTYENSLDWIAYWRSHVVSQKSDSTAAAAQNIQKYRLQSAPKNF